MPPPTSGRAGGIFVALGSTGGFVFGLAVGDPIGWAVLGTAAGIVTAVLVWLVDRRKRG